MSKGKQGQSGGKPRAEVRRRKVFVSFHEELDKSWKDRFVKLMDGWIVDFSFRGDDIKAEGPPNEEILRRIRENHIADATVTVVLIGRCTWRRQFVDWEIHASFRCTNSNPRNGLIGIVLPCHPEYGKPDKDEHLMPPRFADNLRNEPPFAKVYDWPTRSSPKPLPCGSTRPSEIGNGCSLTAQGTCSGGIASDRALRVGPTEHFRHQPTTARNRADATVSRSTCR